MTPDTKAGIERTFIYALWLIIALLALYAAYYFIVNSVDITIDSEGLHYDPKKRSIPYAPATAGYIRPVQHAYGLFFKKMLHVKYPL